MAGGWNTFGVLLIGLVAGAAATCPDKEKHVAVLSDKMGYALMGESGIIKCTGTLQRF